jgi:hypothetical protein
MSAGVSGTWAMSVAMLPVVGAAIRSDDTDGGAATAAVTERVAVLVVVPLSDIAGSADVGMDGVDGVVSVPRDRGPGGSGAATRWDACGAGPSVV